MLLRILGRETASRNLALPSAWAIGRNSSDAAQGRRLLFLLAFRPPRGPMAGRAAPRPASSSHPVILSHPSTRVGPQHALALSPCLANGVPLAAATHQRVCTVEVARGCDIISLLAQFGCSLFKVRAAPRQGSGESGQRLVAFSRRSAWICQAPLESYGYMRGRWEGARHLCKPRPPPPAPSCPFRYARE